MATNYITVKGYIKNGELHVNLPKNVADGEIQIELPVETDKHTFTDDQPLTDEEIDALMKPDPKQGSEIVKNPAIGSWAHKGITDSVKWVAEQRRKRREKRGWSI
jgi:hypothetical protein